MQGYQALEFSVEFGLAAVLAAGATVIVGLAAAANRLAGSAIWRRTIWQVATLGLLALVLAELTGAGSVLAWLWQPKVETDFVPAVGATGGLEMEQPRLSAAAAATVVPKDVTAADRCEPTSRSESVEMDRVLAATSDLASRDPSGSVADDEGDRHSSVKAATVLPERQHAAASNRRAVENPTQEAVSRPPQAPVAGDTVGSSASADYRRWPFLIWGFGAVLITGRIVLGQVLLWIFRRRHAAVLDQGLSHRVSILARQLGIRRPVCIAESEGLTAPVAFGSLRPTIALPVGFDHNFSRPQQAAVLAHELAHLAAGDPVWQLLADLSCAALWWHPFAWWSRRQLRKASEMAADEASLLVPDGPGALADCLVAMGRQLTARRQLQWLSMQGPRFQSGLGRRVERLLSLPRQAWQAPRRGRLAVAKIALPATFVIVAVLCTAWVRPQATLAEGGTTMNVLTISWHRSLAATALAALMCTASGDAAVDNSAAVEPNPTAISESYSTDGPLLALREDRDERGDREAREEEERGDRDARPRQQRQRDEMQRRERREQEGLLEQAKHDLSQWMEETFHGPRPERPPHEMDRRERREGDDHFERLQQQLRQLEEKAEQIKRKLGGLEPDQDDRARELHRALDEIHGRMEDIHRQLRGPEPGRPPREMDRRERREGDDHFERLQQQLHQLEDKAGQIKRKMRDLEPDEDEQARDLHRALDEIHGRMEDIHQQLRGPEPGRPPRGMDRMDQYQQRKREDIARELMQERRKVVERAEAIRRELEQRDDQDSEDAQRLRDELHQVEMEAGALERKMHEIMRSVQGHPGPLPDERQEMKRHVEQLNRKIEYLTEAGRHEEAERVRQEVREMMRRLQRGPQPPREGAPEELQRRIEHLKVAIDNLHAAEMHDMAHQLQEQVDRLIDQHRRRDDRRAEEGPRPPAHPEGPPPPEGPGRVIDELRGQMHELHQEMDEMRQLIKELVREKR